MRTKTLAVAAALLPSLALASAYEVINVNPRDLSMSHSLVAAQQDAAATYMNPAALSRLDGLHLSLGGSILSLKTEWTAPSGGAVSGNAETKFAPTPPVALFAAYGTRVAERGLGFGFGVATPGGGQMKWDEDWAGRGRVITNERRILGFYLNGGVEVLPWVRLGGGLVYYHGWQYIKQGVQPLPDAFAEVSLSGGGATYQVSAEAEPMKNLRIGIDYKHKTSLGMEGDAHFQVPAGLRTPATADQTAKQDLPFANLLTVGAAYRISQPWLVTLQYNYSRWQIWQDDILMGETTTLTIPRRYDDGHVLRGGVEWTPTDRYALRAGLMRDFSGLDTDALSPTLPDSNTWGLTFGGGYSFRPGLTLNGAFFYGDRDRQTATGSSAFPGSYKTTIYIASVGLVWATGIGGGGK